MSALTKMSGELAKLNPEDALPSWWTNKVAVAVDKLDGMADYLDTQVEEVELEEKFKVKDTVIPKTGPHKGVKHTIIHDFGDGTYNVSPDGLSARQIKYRMGAAKAKGTDLKLVKEDVELDEAMKYTHVAVDSKGKLIGLSTKESDAVDMARRNKGKALKLMKPISQKKGDMMVNRTLGGVMGDAEIVRNFNEETELDEAKYDLYHKDFSSAMQHAYAMAKKLHGVTIDPKEIDDKVATGPKKPSKGKTNSYRLKGKGGAIQVQVANLDDKKFELNMYKEEVDLDEMKMNDPKLLKVFDKLKKGDKIKLKTSSTISKGKDFVEYIVKSKNMVNKGKVEKITLATVGNEGAVKKFLYKRDGTVGFAIGDMGASIDDIKEEVNPHMEAFANHITKTEGARDDARRAMRRDPEMRSKGDTADDDATQKDIDNAAKNIIMQLRKSVSMRGQKDVEFASGKQKVPEAIAQKTLDMYNKQRTSSDKGAFQTKIAKSYKDLLNAIKGK
jgi:hypothetical protein